MTYLVYALSSKIAKLVIYGLLLLLCVLFKLKSDPDNTAHSCPDPNCECGYPKADPSRFVRVKK